MTATTSVALAGGLLGTGLWLIWTGWSPARPPLHAVLADLPVHLPVPPLVVSRPEPLALLSPRLIETLTEPLPFTLPDTAKSFWPS